MDIWDRYRVLSFIDDYENIYYPWGDSYKMDGYIYDLYDLLDDPDVKIHSVKNLESGEVFRIGDGAGWRSEQGGEITMRIETLFIIDDDIHAKQKFLSMSISKLDVSRHFKFTSEDAEEVFVGDLVHAVLPKGTWDNLFDLSVHKGFKRKKQWLYFKHKENAEKYIKEHRPIYSEKYVYDTIKKYLEDEIPFTSVDITTGEKHSERIAKEITDLLNGDDNDN